MTKPKKVAAAIALIALLLLLARGVTSWEPGAATPGSSAAEDAVESAGVEAADDAPATPARTRRHALETSPTSDDEPADEPADDTLWRHFTVRILGPGDAPVPGVDLRVEHNPGERHLTDANGEATFQAAKSATSLRILARSLEEEPLTLQEHLTVLRYDDLVPLEIEFIDHESGYPLAVAVHETVLLRSHAGERRERVRLDSVPLRRGRPADFAIEFDAPPGYVHPGEARLRRRSLVSRYADRVRATVPVPRELKLRVLVRRANGKPATDASVVVVATGSAGTIVRADADRTGTIVVRGVPFRRGERVHVSAFDSDGRAAAAQPVFLVDDAQEFVVEIDLPDEPNSDVSIGMGGSAGGAFGGRRGGGRSKLGHGELVVSAFRRNGLPAGGATLELSGPRFLSSRADDEGNATFSSLPPGKYTVTLHEPSLVTTSVEIELAEGERAVVTVKERAGRDATIIVRDAEGRPVASAHLTVTLLMNEPFIQLIDGTQEFDLLTDLHGGCDLTGLPSGAVTVKADFGSRSASGTLAEDILELVLGE